MQWPEASLYLPRLLESVFHGNRDEYLVARSDYDWIAPSRAPVLPSGPRKSGVNPRGAAEGRGEDGEEVVEQMLTGWWLAWGSARALDRL
jgi:hypothetical protein